MQDDADDAEWTGRPQDDPRLHAMAAKARAEFRQKHPPVNCWIDQVQTIELYLDGVRRAQVERDRAMITYFDDQGDQASTAIYLHSENPYDVVEDHLGTGRIVEVRDESLEALETFSSYPRECEERSVGEFSRGRFRDDEIFEYLRRAAGALKHEATGDLHQLALTPILEAITASVLDQYESALIHVQAAASALEKRERSLLFGRPVLANCRRAIVGIERHIAIQNRKPVRWKEPSGKSGG